MVFGVKSLLCGATTKNTMNGESNIVFIVYCLRRGWWDDDGTWWWKDLLAVAERSGCRPTGPVLFPFEIDLGMIIILMIWWEESRKILDDGKFVILIWFHILRRLRIQILKGSSQDQHSKTNSSSQLHSLFCQPVRKLFWKNLKCQYWPL